MLFCYGYKSIKDFGEVGTIICKNNKIPNSFTVGIRTKDYFLSLIASIGFFLEIR